MPDTTSRFNERRIYMAAGAMGAANGLIAPFLAVFALQLGGTAREVALLTSLPSLLSLIGNLALGGYVARLPLKGPAAGNGALLARLTLLPILLAPILASRYPESIGGAPPAVWLLIGTTAAAAIPGVWYNLGKLLVLDKALPAATRGKVLGTRFIVMQAVTLLSTLLGGAALDHMPPTWGFPVLVLFVGGCGLLEARWLACVRERPSKEITVRGGRLGMQTLMAAKGILSQNAPFRRYGIAFMSWQLVATAITPLIPVHLVNHMGATNGWIGILTAVSGVTGIAGYRHWGPYADRHGNGRVIQISVWGAGLTYGLLAVTPSILFFLPVYALLGFFGSAYNVAHQKSVLDLTDEDAKSRSLSLITMMSTIAAIAGPSLGAFLVQHMHFPLAFAILAAAQIGTSILFLRVDYTRHLHGTFDRGEMDQETGA